MSRRFRLRIGTVALALSLVPTTGRAAEPAADVRTVCNRLLQPLLQPPPPADVAAALRNLRPDGGWSDIDYGSKLVSAWPLTEHLARLEVLARAGRSNPAAHAAATRALAFWLDHDFTNPNWFWNQIGVPSRLAPTLLLMWDQMSPPQHDVAIKILSRAKIEQSGTNLVWLSMVVAQRGILQNDPALVAKAYGRIAQEIHPSATQSGGPQPDDSFMYHGPLLYSWGYGIAFLHDNIDLAVLLEGTTFAVPPAKVALLRDWTLDGAQWMTRADMNDFGADGREIARMHHSAKDLVAMGTELLSLHPGREPELRAMVARASQAPHAPPLVGNKQYWRADLMAHHRPGYYASARMYSARTKNTESINGENLYGSDLAEGTNVLMRTGREYDDIFPLWDWQRVPGTTVEQLPDFAPDHKAIEHKTPATFVGGASDGDHGVSGGELVRGTLRCHKAWFFFDDEYVCLGAGLSCDGDHPVATTLDQRFLNGPVLAKTAGTVRTVPDGPQSLAAVTWLLHDGVGYVFPTPTPVGLNDGPRAASWGTINLADAGSPPVHGDVFEAHIDHGPRPADAGYAYVVVPNAGTAVALDRYASASPVAIASNTPAVQAAWHKALRAGGALFFEPGHVELRPGLTVTVDAPCAMWIAERANGVAVSVSNPKNAAAVVHVTVHNGDRTAAADVALPDKGDAGRSVTTVVGG